VYTGILTAPPQLVRSLSDNKSAHFAADRDPAIDKGPLARSLTNWRGEERDPLTCCSIRARAHCDCCCRCPQRVARNQFIHTVFLSSAVGSFKSPTFGPVARTQERHRHWNALCPLPDANYHPLRSNSQDSVWPGPTTLTGALLLAVTTERERPHKHSYPSYTFEKRPASWHRLSCRYLSLISDTTDTWTPHTSVSIFSQNKVTDKPQKDNAWRRSSWNGRTNPIRVSSAGQRHRT
jgi:hypothetical protein